MANKFRQLSKADLSGFVFYVHLPSQRIGTIAQLVEQRTENPCVVGSIPTGTTKAAYCGFFFARSLLFITNP